MPQHSWVDNGPFLIERGEVACLVVHGFAGSPAEVRPFAEALADKGITVYAPVLPGHASTAEALIRHDRHDWLRTVEEAFDWLCESHAQVFVAGLSMGALLSIRLAQHRKVSGLVLMAPALIARDQRLKFAGALSFLKDYVPEAFVPRAGLVDPKAWKRMWHYERRALRALSQLYKLQMEARIALPSVHVPTLIFHGLKDLTVPERAAIEVMKLLGSTNKELIWLEDSGHCLTADGEVELVSERVNRFVDQIA